MKSWIGWACAGSLGVGSPVVPLGRRAGRLCVLVLVSGVATGCPGPTAIETGADAPVLFLTQASGGGPVMEALYTGRVSVDARGCMVLEDSEGRETVVWPFAFQLWSDQEGLKVRDSGGVQVAEVGEPTRFGGGFVSDLPTGLLRPAMAQAAVERCPGGYWLVGETGL